MKDAIAPTSGSAAHGSACEIAWVEDEPNVTVVFVRGPSATFNDEDTESDPWLCLNPINTETTTFFRKRSQLQPLATKADWKRYLDAKKAAEIRWHQSKLAELTATA